jgi:RNA polymerase sigma-70 factor (ECF subfamily)
MDDKAAIKKCQLGDWEAFRYLVERYQRQAVAHATVLLLNRDDAVDAVQEAFIDVFKAIDRFDTSRPFYQWFYVLLRNRCYKMTTRQRPTGNIDEVLLVASPAGIDPDLRIGLERALESLPREDREIVSMKYLDGLSYDEIAAHLQIPQGTVMSRLFYARKRLNSKLTGTQAQN